MTEPWAVETMADARRAVWPDDWDGGVAHCLSMIEPALSPPDFGTVVDIGCGVGRILHPIADRHPLWDCVGIDPSLSMIAHCMTSASPPNVGYTTGSWDRLPPCAAAYSVVTFQHLPVVEQRHWIEAVAAALHPGGRFRFQWTPEGDTGPLCHPVPVDTMTSWCQKAGMTAAAEGDPQFPTWAWMTCQAS